MTGNGIERISMVDKSKLSGEHYFESLIEEGYKTGLLNDQDIERIQLMCLELIAEKTKRYTSGDSSSVRVEVAENIMRSNFYTVGIFLKSFSVPDDAIRSLKETSITKLYYLGRELIKTKLQSAKYFHSVILKNRIKTYNYTYTSTIVDGIIGFFKIYDADFDSHEIHITADYPLCNPVVDLAGIEFIQKYLESVHFENIFCKCFSNETIHHLLCGYDNQYKDLIFNLFEQVLTAAIGCMLAGTEVRSLTVSRHHLKLLENIFLQKSRGEILDEIIKAYQKLVQEINLTSPLVQKYIEKALPLLAANIDHALKINRLESVFYEPQYIKMHSNIYFSFGHKMDDRNYRCMIDEIMSCRFISDKINMIKEKIHSLADLEDALLDAEFNEEEMSAVLKELDLTEIAALAKRHPYRADIEAIELSEPEQRLRLCLDQHILSLPREKQSEIAKLITVLECDKEE